MEPLVSVCIPAYNNTETIQETIHSILKQSYLNLEVIVVDDASKDNTYSLVKAIAEKDKRVKLYKNETNLGMAGNWNRAMNLGVGKYIKIMGADDLLKKQALEKEVKALEEHPTAVLAESDSQVIDINGKARGVFKRYWRTGLVSGKKVAKRCAHSMDLFGSPVANLIRKSVLAKTGGFDPSFHYIVDYDFFMSIAAEGDIFIIREPLNGFRIRKESNTGKVMGGGDEKRYIAEHRRLLEKHKDTIPFSKFDIALSMFLRRAWSFAVSVFMKMFVR